MSLDPVYVNGIDVPSDRHDTIREYEILYLWSFSVLISSSTRSVRFNNTRGLNYFEIFYFSTVGNVFRTLYTFSNFYIYSYTTYI